MLAMAALDDEDDGIHETAKAFLTHVTDGPMESSASALEWWGQNATRFDYNMVELVSSNPEDDEFFPVTQPEGNWEL